MKRNRRNPCQLKKRSSWGSLREALHDLVTPALWKQAHGQRRVSRKRKSPRWQAQPLILMLLFMTWSTGDSQPERFEVAKAYCQVCLKKRRHPGKSVQGYQKALSRLPMSVLRIFAAGVRRLVFERLGDDAFVEGFIPIGCDGSRIECPRATELEKRLGQAGKDKSAPTMWVTALVHLRWGMPWAWRLGKGTASERGHMLHLLKTLPRQALLVADAGYCGFGLAEQLVNSHVKFLFRMSGTVTLYTQEQARLENYREGEVYYWPSEKGRLKYDPKTPPLHLRLIRIKARRRKNDVWLLTNVMDKEKLPHAAAGQMYRWRWQNEGCFRTYKHTLKKVKLVSRSVRLVHREAEGAWLALQLLMAQGLLAQRENTRQSGHDVPRACQEQSSPRKILIAIRQEMAAAGQCQGNYEQRLKRAKIENRKRTSAKATRVWPRRKPHKAPKPPKIRMLSQVQKALLARLNAQAAYK